MNKIKNMIKIGIKKDSVSGRIVNVEYFGKTQKALLLLPYGFFSNPPEDLPAVLLSDQCNEESISAIVSDIENREELGDTEIGVGIPTEEARIYFREGGKITFKIGETEGGDFLARFNELKVGFDELNDKYNDLVTKYNAHVHNFVGVGPGNPGTTVATASTETPSTASIDDAKIEEIEVPEL